MGIPKGFPKSVGRVGSRLHGFPCFPYSVRKWRSHCATVGLFSFLVVLLLPHFSWALAGRTQSNISDAEFCSAIAGLNLIAHDRLKSRPQFKCENSTCSCSTASSADSLRMSMLPVKKAPSSTEMRKTTTSPYKEASLRISR